MKMEIVIGKRQNSPCRRHDGISGKYRNSSTHNTILYSVCQHKLHNEKLNDLYSSPNIVRVIKSRRMRWVGHVARMGEERGVYRV
jgi:hypothetical protein